MLEAWLTDLSNPLTYDQYERLLNNIAVEKKTKLGKFLFYEDAQRSLLGDLLIRMLIYKYNYSNKKTIVFKENKYGKPYLADSSNIHFNISHSGNHVVCAICDKPVGIDIEDIKPIDLNIAKRFFTSNEYNYITMAKSIESKYQKFYFIWTRKEAYVKQQGIGLNIPLNTFDVLESHNDIYFKCIYENGDSICNICYTKKEYIKIHYISAQELVLFFDTFVKLMP